MVSPLKPPFSYGIPSIFVVPPLVTQRIQSLRGPNRHWLPLIPEIPWIFPWILDLHISVGPNMSRLPLGLNLLWTRAGEASIATSDGHPVSKTYKNCPIGVKRSIFNGKITIFLGKSTISMAMFNCYVSSSKDLVVVHISCKTSQVKMWFSTFWQNICSEKLFGKNLVV